MNFSIIDDKINLNNGLGNSQITIGAWLAS